MGVVAGVPELPNVAVGSGLPDCVLGVVAVPPQATRPTTRSRAETDRTWRLFLC
jgi:hypothetical protein